MGLRMNEFQDFNEKIDKFFTDNSKENVDAILKPIDEMEFEGPTLEDIFKEERRMDKKLKSEYKKKLNGLINVNGVFKHLDDNISWEPEGIVDIELTDDRESGYSNYQHARIVGEDSKRLYMKMPENEIRGVDHYYVWQRTGYLGDDYSGWMLFPLKDGRYFKVHYNC